MAHPYITVSGKQWTEFLEHFKTGIAYLSLKNGNDEDTTRELIEKYKETVDNKKELLFEVTAIGIVEYCNFYSVHPKEGIHDEFKGIYFTGIAISHYLIKLGLVELNKLHLKAMLGLLDYRLSTPNKVNRPELSRRIRSIIDNNAIDEHLGKYGWYLLYKCLFNAADLNGTI